jgi:putative tryptophan/tyrosine transport system substrate-binding protein
MKRREFIAGLGAVALPLGAGAQQSTTAVIGFLHSESPGPYTAPILRAFHQGLSESGYVEGRNIAIEYRWAESRYSQLPELAADLVRRRVTVMTANGPAIQAARTATMTVPIVFFAGDDPVKLGFAASLSRPGGNLTGVSNLGVELGPKRLELLHELIPTATNFAALVNPTFPDAEAQIRGLQAAAATLSSQLHVLRASSERDFDMLFATLAERHVGGFVIATDPFFNNRATQLGALALQHAIPAVYHMHEFVTAGGLARISHTTAT